MFVFIVLRTNVNTRRSDFYEGNKQLPVYSRPKTRSTTKQVVNIILQPNLSNKAICTMQPTCVQHNTLFIVNLSCLKSVKDLGCDDLGTWKAYGKYSSNLTVNEDGDVSLHRDNPGTCDTYEIVKRYFQHQSSKDFTRTFFFLYSEYYRLMHACIYSSTYPHCNLNTTMSFYVAIDFEIILL